MIVFLLKRSAGFLVALAAATLIVFLVLEVLPGDPARVMLGVEAQPESVKLLRAELGLDRSAPERYVAWIGGLVRGDLGTSYTYHVPVAELIGERLAVTVPLALISNCLSFLLALVLGLYAASHRDGPGDVGIMAATQLGIAVPNFWFAILLILLFAVTLGWLPSGGFPGWSAGIGTALKSLLLPALSLALVQAAVLARITRSAVLDILGEDFVRTARAKGNSRNRTLWRHVLRNALIPVVTIMGLQFSTLLAGTIIVENVFYLPGLGRLVFQAITQHDLVVIKDVVVLLAALVIVINFAVDLLYLAIDPRLRSRA
ncbi:MAG TPA: ABC transporter permease [Stellaceae bacterium]|jgi:peptide/nickel transport system permease protein|nr:ABC transporter permease [Stellaceae bacterium]